MNGLAAGLLATRAVPAARQLAAASTREIPIR